MSADLDVLVEGYLDGSLDAAGADELARALRAGGAEGVQVRERIAFAGLLAQALDPADGDAVVRAVDERLAAQQEASGFVRTVERSLPRRRRRARSRSSAPLAIAALLLLALGRAWWFAHERPAPPAICRISAADAGSRIERVSGGVAASVDAALFADDVVIAHGALTVCYADGSELTLSDGARLRVLGDEARERVSLEAGMLVADVASQPGGRGFAIVTPEARVEAVGTRFTLVAAAGRTRLELRQGTVRLARLSDGRAITVAAGESAEVAPGVELVAQHAAPLPAPAPSALFPSHGLDGWWQQHGTWSNDGGVVRGAPDGDSARLLSQRAYADLELTCRLRIAGVDKAEVQVGDYNWFFSVPAKPGWIEVRLVQRGEELSCTADGVPLARERGAGRPARPGPLSFYVRAGGTLEIADARIVAPISSGGSP